MSIQFQPSLLQPPNQTAPGLEPLARTTKLFLVKIGKEDQEISRIKMTVPPSFSIMTCYKIYDSFGTHIFSAGEVRHQSVCTCCSECSEFSSVILIFSVDSGEPILSLCKRNETCFVRKKSAQNQIEPLYHVDKVMTGPVDNMSYSNPRNLRRMSSASVAIPMENLKDDDYTEEDPQAFLHLQHIAAGNANVNRPMGSGRKRDDALNSSLTSGSFLGHYWENSRVFVIHDARFLRILAIADKEWLKEMKSNLKYRKDIKRARLSYNKKQKKSSDDLMMSAKDLEKRSVKSKKSVVSNLDTVNKADMDDMIDDNPSQVMQDLLDQAVIWSKTPSGRQNRTFNSSSVYYNILEGGVPVGYVENDVDVDTMNIEAKPEDSYVAVFPREFTQVDKALIMGFLLYKASLSSRAKKTSSWSWFGCISTITVILFVIVHIADGILFIFQHYPVFRKT